MTLRIVKRRLREAITRCGYCGKGFEARAPLERALVTLLSRVEVLVEVERAELQGRRATLAEVQHALQEAREALRRRWG